MTIIECLECDTKLIESNYGKNNAAATCSCGNLQLIVAHFTPPSELETYLSIRYSVSYPSITEIIVENNNNSIEEPEKRLGFN